MKKKITAVILAMTMLTGAMAGCGKTAQTPKLEGSCIDIMNRVYETAELDAGLREAMTYYETTTITDDREEYILGTDDVDYTDSAYSAPMMTSVAYQCVVLRIEPDEDILQTKQLLLDRADKRKWICVEAESVVVENVGDVILYVMADKTTADALKTAFLELGDAQNTK